mgnify:CR=1 FL=1
MNMRQTSHPRPYDYAYHYRARAYDPDTGRFLQHDPVWNTNPYTYVGNNPVVFIDPHGNEAKSTTGGFNLRAIVDVQVMYGVAWDDAKNKSDVISVSLTIDGTAGATLKGDFTVLPDKKATVNDIKGSSGSLGVSAGEGIGSVSVNYVQTGKILPKKGSKAEDRMNDSKHGLSVTSEVGPMVGMPVSPEIAFTRTFRGPIRFLFDIYHSIKSKRNGVTED